MEIKKKNLLINIASVILTISIFVGMSLFYTIRINANILNLLYIMLHPKMLIIDILIIINIYIVFKYIKTTMKLLFDKKIVKSFIMLFIAAILISLVIYIVKYANSYLRLIAFNVLIILEVTLVPIIFLAIMIYLTRKKSKKTKIIFIGMAVIVLLLRCNKMD